MPCPGVTWGWCEKPINSSIMKLYVVYFRTMQDSPEVEIRIVTTDQKVAKEKLREVKKEEREWMKDEDEDSGNWAEAKMCAIDINNDLAVGDVVVIVTFTLWHECVETTLTAHKDLDAAEAYIADEKRKLKADYEGISPFYEDVSFDDSLHLADDSVMVDAYFGIAEFDVI